jgi:hypothetical protein
VELRRGEGLSAIPHPGFFLLPMRSTPSQQINDGDDDDADADDDDDDDDDGGGDHHGEDDGDDDITVETINIESFLCFDLPRSQDGTLKIRARARALSPLMARTLGPFQLPSLVYSILEKLYMI